MDLKQYYGATLSDLLVFFSLRSDVTRRWTTLSFRKFCGSLLDNVTNAVKSTGRESNAASSCHFAVSFMLLIFHINFLNDSRFVAGFTSLFE